MDVDRPKISVYSLAGRWFLCPGSACRVLIGADLKNTTDDALPNYLNSLKFKQSHYYTDIRHLLGFTAIAISAVTFYFDYTLGWEKTKTGTLWAVITYFILNGALTFWIWAVERGCVYVGDLKDVKVCSLKVGWPLGGLPNIMGHRQLTTAKMANFCQLLIRSRVEKHNPTYFLSARYCKPNDANQWHTIDAQAPFSKWFDAQGHFVAQQFQQWLATQIPVIGGADPSNVIPQASSDEKVRQGDPSVLQTALEQSRPGQDETRNRTKAKGQQKNIRR